VTCNLAKIIIFFSLTIGGLLHSNPDAFFIYEPMDMLYTALYGISPGWSVPADIFYTGDGVLR